MPSILRYCYLLVAALLAFAATSARAMHFYLKGSTQTCFGQDILRDPSEKTVRVDVYYHLHYSNPNGGTDEDGAKMTVYLGAADSKPVKGSETVVPLKNSKSEMASYYASQSGFYFFCFEVQAPKVSSYKAEVEIIPTNAHHEEAKAISGVHSRRNKDGKKKKKSGMGVTKDDYLRRINVIDALMKSSEDEAAHLLGRQREFDTTVQSTHMRVIYFTVANAIVVFGTAGWQMLHLKRFFKSKKLV